jgi:uncharacterized protein YecE (DUF72 family)
MNANDTASSAQAKRQSAPILVGTASWTDHEPFYPPEYQRKEMSAQRISYYSRYFPLVEVDSTFYRLLPQRNFQLWSERTPEHFRFDVKAFGELTWHHRTDDGQQIEPRTETFAQFAEMMQPLRDTGKLRALLFQFPPWFTFSPENLDYFATVREQLPQELIAVEFRHRSWLEARHADETASALRDNQLAYVIVDEPQIGSGSVPPTTLVTDQRLALFRFHGRNTHTWYGRGLESSRQRFDYLYSKEELAPWAQRIQGVAEQIGSGGEVHVTMNNNARNYAIINGINLQTLLGQQPGQGEPLPPAIRQALAEQEQGLASTEGQAETHQETQA